MCCAVRRIGGKSFPGDEVVEFSGGCRRSLVCRHVHLPCCTNAPNILRPMQLKRPRDGGIRQRNPRRVAGSQDFTSQPRLLREAKTIRAPVSSISQARKKSKNPYEILLLLSVRGNFQLNQIRALERKMPAVTSSSYGRAERLISVAQHHGKPARWSLAGHKFFHRDKSCRWNGRPRSPARQLAAEGSQTPQFEPGCTDHTAVVCTFLPILRTRDRRRERKDTEYSRGHAPTCTCSPACNLHYLRMYKDTAMNPVRRL